MKVSLIAIGKRMPEWVTTAFETYAKRLSADFSLLLSEIPLPKRCKTSVIPKLIEQEGQAMLNAIPKGNLVVALEVTGKMYSTPQLAKQLQTWHEESRDISLLIGGPDGLAQSCLQRADVKWSLSALTLPHPLVRVIVAEQIYRAVSILAGHPYHR